jgi:hypothetical protein
VQRRGVRVTVVSTIRTQPPMVADELRRQADRFVDLAELQPYIAREYVPRSDEPARVPAQAGGGGEGGDAYEDDDDDDGPENGNGAPGRR